MMRTGYRRAKETKSKRRHIVGLGALLLGVISFVLAVTIGRRVLHEFTRGNSSTTILASGWKKYPLAGTELSLELPGEPQTTNFEVPEPLRAQVREVRVYKCAVEGLQVVVWNALYEAGTAYDLERAADGAIHALKNCEGVTNYEDTVTRIVRSGRSGLLVRGTFNRQGSAMKRDAVLLGEESKLWQVTVTHPASDRNADAACKRVLDSIEINLQRSRLAVQFNRRLAC